MGLSDQLIFKQDIKIVPDEDLVRGMYFENTKRSVVYARTHECIEDLIQTCVHETLHHVIDTIDEDLELDSEQEHRIIKFIQWGNEHLV